MYPRPFTSRPQVIQGNFQGQMASLVIQPRSVASPQTAPPAQAVLQRHGTAFLVPPSVPLAPHTPGSPLPPAVQQKMEAFFGADFSAVRVHTGPEAQRIGAQAFTMGSAIYFAPGHYDPHSASGQRLLGHELAHVVQQRAGRVHNPFGTGVAVVQQPHLEQEADRLGHQAALVQPQPPAPRPTKALRAYQLHVQPKHNGRQRITAIPRGAPDQVGAVELRPFQQGTFEILNLKVEPAHRRRGLGSALTQAALVQAQQAGSASVRLEARPSDPSISAQALAGFYERFGFSYRGVSRRGHPIMERSSGGLQGPSAAAFAPKRSLHTGGASVIQQMEEGFPFETEEEQRQNDKLIRQMFGEDKEDENRNIDIASEQDEMTPEEWERLEQNIKKINKHNALLDEMERDGVKNIEALRKAYKDVYTKGQQVFQSGYEYQIQRTYDHAKQPKNGGVEAVEYCYNRSNRADTLFKDGSLGEYKNTANWGSAWKQFDKELEAYAASGKSMYFFIEPAPPRDIEAMIRYYYHVAGGGNNNNSTWTLNGTAVIPLKADKGPELNPMQWLKDLDEKSVKRKAERKETSTKEEKETREEKRRKI